MMRPTIKFVIGVVAVIALLAVVASAGEAEAVEKENLPEAVLKAFQKAYPNVQIAGYDTETEKGQTHYEIETKADQFEKDYIYLEDGTLVQIEEGMPVKSLPQSVMGALKKAHPGGEVEEAEKITRGTTIEYEIVVEVDDGEFEMLVSSDGQVLASGEMEEEEEEDHHDHDADHDDDDHDHDAKHDDDDED
jgi:hypothetical protein